MPKVVMLTTLAPTTAQRLVEVAPPGYEVEVHSAKLPVEAQQDAVANADFLILFPPSLDNAVLSGAKRLKLIQLVSAGFDQIDIDLCRRMGIPVANNGGANALDVAEHTLTLLLAMYRRLREMDANVRLGRWDAIDSGATTYTIQGKTVGIIGLGNIGRHVARLLRAFGATLLYADAESAPIGVEQELGIVRVELDDLLQRADAVTLHVPLNASTRGLIGARELALMKPSAVLINTCRGPVIDEQALAAALRDGVIAGAALDVLTQEPPDPANPLFELDNVLLTPHSAGVTVDTWARRGRFVFENLQRVWNGEPPLAVVS
jgi:phosphoglycerate dehydrogenase-like enzyme